MSQETIEQLLNRVRDYDQHTSDADIDRLCDDLERLRELAEHVLSHPESPPELHDRAAQLLDAPSFAHGAWEQYKKRD